MDKQVVAIGPREVSAQKAKGVPAAVIEAFNELIAQEFGQGEAKVLQKDVVQRIVAKGIKRKAIFANHWLDVEMIFREKGWIVAYDRPGYNESYEAFFVFSTK